MLDPAGLGLGGRAAALASAAAGALPDGKNNPRPVQDGLDACEFVHWATIRLTCDTRVAARLVLGVWVWASWGYVRGMANDWDDLADALEREAIDAVYEETAQGIAKTAREAGLTSADGVELDIHSDTGEKLDYARLRRRANQILALG
ncbi:hypothetical protein QFZ29_002677 [Agromyces albus]|nr:hypothetical protein [Agromyces albus]